MSLLRSILFALAALIAATTAHAQIAFRAADSAGVASAGDIAFVGAGGANVQNGCGTANPGIPGGLAGDLLIAVVEASASPVITMAGWTQLYLDNPAANHTAAVFWRLRTGGDPNAVVQAGACNVMIARIAAFRGVDPVTPLQTFPLGGGSIVSQNTGDVDTGTETTLDPNAMLVYATHVTDNRTVAAAGGFTEAFDSTTGTGNDVGISLAYQQQTTAGAKGPILNMDLSGGGNDWNTGALFALRPAGLRINVPAGTVAGDVMIASVAVRDSPMVITPPLGWTLVREDVQAAGGGATSRMAAYMRVATALEPASYLWTFSNGSATGAAGVITSFSGVDTAAPIDVHGGNATPSGATHTAASITTTEPGTMLVGAFAYGSSTSDWSPPAGMTEAAEAASLAPPDDLGISMEVAYETWASAGATGARAATASTAGANADQGVAQLIALRPVVSVTHYAISVLSGTVANCDYAEVTLTAHNAGHIAVNPPVGRVVALSVSAGAATAAWQPTLVVGAGVWTPAGATATYAWSGTESSFTVRLRQSAVITLTVNAFDTFVTEDMTEDPPISFVESAFRVSNGANAALAVGSQIAAKPSNAGAGAQSLYLQAIRTDTVTGACTSVFPSGSEVDVEVGAQCNNPAACTQNVTLTTTSGGGSPTGNFVPAGAGSYPATIRFRFTTAEAEAPFFFSYADAGQITLQFRHVTAAAPATTIAGTSNAFVTRPFGLAFRGADAATAIQHGALPTDALLAAAGDNYTMTLAAYRWASAEDDGTGNPLAGANLTDNGLTPNFASSSTVSATGNLPGVQTGAMSRGAGCAGAAIIAAGSWSGGAATIGDWCYSEVGNVFLSASAADYFGIVGFNVSGNSGLDGDAAGGYVGRFKPKHFVATGAPTLANREALACASTFTYMNEGLQLGFTLEARNAQNVLTQNYTGVYAKLNLASMTNLGIGARSGATILTPRVDNALVPGGSVTNGVASLTAVTGIRRASPDNPDGPYAATQFAIAPNDNDPNAATGVQMQSFDLDADGGIPGNDHFAIAPATELRYGRLRLQNAYGPVSQALPIALEAQYWNGGGFVANAQDDCTSLARANIALSFTGAIAACDTFVQQASIAFAAGSATLTLSPPGAGKTGTVLLTPQLGTAAGSYCPAVPGGTAASTASPAAYLLGRWDDAANPDADGSTSYDDPPAGQAGFGLYGSQPKNFIFFRENY